MSVSSTRPISTRMSVSLAILIVGIYKRGYIKAEDIGPASTPLNQAFLSSARTKRDRDGTLSLISRYN